MMIAMTINEKREFVRSTVADPVLKNNEVLVEVHAAALNRADLMQRAGNYPPPPGWPEWPGLEISGIVLDSGTSRKWKKGDKVCALLGGGGYAEKAAVPESLLMPVPEGVSMIEAAALPEVFATSYLDLKMTGKLEAGETVLIHAGASGLGLAAIQTAKLLGAKVMTTVGSEEKGKIVKEFGADLVVNRRTDDLARVMEANPVNVVMDCVGTGISHCIDKMAFGGRWILIANLGGDTATIPLAQMYKKNLTVTGITLRSRPEQVKEFILSEIVKWIWPAISDGRIRTKIHAVFPLEQAAEAHGILERNENIGKVVLTTGKTMG